MTLSFTNHVNLVIGKNTFNIRNTRCRRELYLVINSIPLKGDFGTLGEAKIALLDLLCESDHD